jgi:uncharacterized membrane protein (UPF0127 family)
MPVLVNASTGEIVATRVERARTFVDRAVGLLTRARVRPDEGLWIEPCDAIHTIGMRAAIDVIFLDREQRVLRLCPAIPSFRLAVVCRGARSVVELGAGALELVDVLVGDRLDLA